MAAVFALLTLAVAAITLCIVLDQDAGEMLPFTVFSVILYLYFFYCANALTLGMISLYVLLAALLCYALFLAVKRKIDVRKKITPAFVVFCCTAAFFAVYTIGNYSVNWDELRVWSAMPKAIYETKELQLGAGALIFDTADNMQTYPPALPLFANFFLCTASSFTESYIFLAYAVFVSVITVSPFRKLHWNHWWAMPFATFFVICVPFVLTLHGGDYSYFYQALFIDPVLGFAAGYVFYLATTKPFRTGFSRMQFALALSVLVIIKDSGILFALLSVLCALCIRRADEKGTSDYTFERPASSGFPDAPLLPGLERTSGILQHLKPHSSASCHSHRCLHRRFPRGSRSRPDYQSDRNQILFSCLCIDPAFWWIYG